MEKIDEIDNTNEQEFTIVNVEKNNNPEIKQERSICRGVIYTAGACVMLINTIFTAHALLQTEDPALFTKIIAYVNGFINMAIAHEWQSIALNAFWPKNNNTSKKEEIKEALNEKEK